MVKHVSKVDNDFLADFIPLVERHGFQYTDFLDLIRYLSIVLREEVISRSAASDGEALSNG